MIIMKGMTVCLLLLLATAWGQSTQYNGTLCIDIQIDQLHYYINSQQNNYDITYQNGSQQIVYNLCKQVEVYCEQLNAVVVGSLVVKDSVEKTCIAFRQTAITFLQLNNASSGLNVTYVADPPHTMAKDLVMSYPCHTDNSIGCPSVQSGIMWDYFTKNIIPYTIVLQVIGAILMVLGIYIYRGSIVLIGWGTSFIILLMIQSLFVFLKGVPDTLIQNVLILTLICSFLVGYILGYFPKAGVFCMGLWIGFVITLTLNNIAFYYISSNPPNLMLYIVTPVLSIGFGILIIFIKRTFIIFASSLIGSYICLRALSWHLGAFPNQFQISKKYHFGLSPPVPWQFYLYVVALLILTASSSALQTWLFKKKMRKTNQQTDLDAHLDKMEHNLDQERDHLIQFKNVFQNQPQRQPRVLSRDPNSHPRNKNTSLGEVDQVSQHNSSHQSEDESLPPYQDTDGDHDQFQDEPASKSLNKKLLGVKERR